MFFVFLQVTVNNVLAFLLFCFSKNMIRKKNREKNPQLVFLLIFCYFI